MSCNLANFGHGNILQSRETFCDTILEYIYFYIDYFYTGKILRYKETKLQNYIIINIDIPSS